MKYGILPNITEKKIYFADIGQAVDYRDSLDDSIKELKNWFDYYLVEYNVENKLETKIYKEMMNEYERLEHLRRCVCKRLDLL